MRLQWRSLFVSSILCLAVPVSGKKDAPSVTITKFDDFIPRNVVYFDDSDVMLLEDSVGHNVYRSDNAGESWGMVEGVPKGKLYELMMHPFDNKRAYIIMDGKNHYRTSDRGNSWEKFHTDAPATMLRPRGEALVFHAGDPDRIIFNGMDCSGIFCEELAMYTTSGFSKETKFLRSDVTNCHWAKSSPVFTTGDKDMDANRIICVAKGRFSPWPKDHRLLISDTFFAKGDGVQEFEPKLESGRTVKGIVNMATVTKYLIVAASADGTDEMALYVSDDTIRFHRAIFSNDHKLREAAYTVLESTGYSIQVDVMSSSPANPMGALFSSNSNGTYFQRNIEHTNRNEWGLVDFEKISGIQGIVMVNVVDNYEEVEKSRKAKKIKSQISFDDGRTFQGLTCDEDPLHLHSVTDLSNSGRVFSSPAPGLVMGIGNTGDHLKSYKKGNLYVSDNAGVSWREGLKGPHKYEFGDQGSILVAVADEPTDKIQYSLNHGKDWNSVDIGKKVKPVQLTTTLDSTSLKFILEGIDPGAKSDRAGYIIAIDFDDMHEAKCTASDMVKWSARVDKDNEPTCLMGHTQSYTRRKADADCFIKNEFEDPVAETSDCECTDDDFECDYNFVRSSDRKECELSGNLIPPEDACKKDSDEKFLGSSGWRLIPGNTCKRTSGAQRDDPVEHSCKETSGEHSPASGKIQSTQKVFPGNNFQNKVYLERTDVSTGTDETVLVRTEKGVFISHDHGKVWKQIFKDEPIIAIIPHQYFKDVVFFLTPKNKVYYSTERGENIRSFKAPLPPNAEGYPAMSFHWKHKDWIIWTGAKDCRSKDNCHSVASISKDRGDEWQTLQRYVRRCQFIREDKMLYLTPPSELGKKTNDPEKLIYCEVREKEKNTKLDNPWQLVASNNFFDDEPRVHFTNVVDFATMSEFIVVATKDEDHETLRVNASVDGTTFSAAQFPHGFVVPHQKGYTVLDSSTHSVFLHVTVNNEKSLEYGSIIKSNSNGTSYVLSLSGVDRDSVGYVDFEKTLGLEGVALVNVVTNYDSKNYAKEGKKSKTMITHNDGAEWDFIPPPKVDAEGKKFDCKGDINKCSLNIHGYTEREIKAHTYSSSSAIEFMFGTGSVGEYLTEDADTFMTSDGGITWKSVKKGKYKWAYGDQGSILVIVKDRGATNVLYYSLDEGDTWEEYKFSDAELEVNDLTTVPSDNSRNFLIWASKDREPVAVNLDFTGLTNTRCKLDEDNVDEGDYYLWTPRHPKQDSECLFGHISQYHRKKPSSNCYNGLMVPSLHDIAQNCTCTRRDYECDFNYERQADGTCALVAGVEPPDHSLACLADPSLEEYYSPTGYRRIPATTCQGGGMDKSTPHPCPGHEDSFRGKHGPSGIAIFFAVIIPIVVATGVGYWVWNNWASKFGQIRLGEQSSFDSEAPYIKYPVLVVAGVVAVVQALPLLIVSLWRSASSMIGRGSSRRFTTRDSFARGRGDYAIVDEDEGELLGDESDEEV